MKFFENLRYNLDRVLRDDPAAESKLMIYWQASTTMKMNNTLQKSNSNHVSFALPYSSTACG